MKHASRKLSALLSWLRYLWYCYRHPPLVRGFAGRADICGIGEVGVAEDGNVQVSHWFMRGGRHPGIECDLETGLFKFGGWPTAELSEISAAYRSDAW